MSAPGPRAGGRPVPLPRAVGLLAAGLLPAVLAVVDPAFLLVALALDFAVLVLCAADYLAGPTARGLVVERRVEPVLSSGEANPVVLVLRWTGSGRACGEVRDEVPGSVEVSGHRQPFDLSPSAPEALLIYRVRPPARGDLSFGDLHLRLHGPLGLCARQVRVPAAQKVKVYPDLTALTREALGLAAAAEDSAERTIRRPSEGREFESLREYRPGDDYRTIDWKASARKAKTMVRVYQPERNQSVMLVLDCGRHMAGKVAGRRKLDHAVDAALRVAKICLDKGDLVGVVAFATDVHTLLLPRRGRDHLRTLTDALYRIEARLEESDYGRALDLAFSRYHKRTLVVLFTDLLDADTSAALVARTLRLRPRHLPLVVSLTDEDLESAASDEPRSVKAAYVRQAAARLEEEYRLTAAHLRNAGSLVVRAPARRFSAAAVNEYLRVKAHGLL